MAGSKFASLIKCDKTKQAAGEREQQPKKKIHQRKLVCAKIIINTCRTFAEIYRQV